MLPHYEPPIQGWEYASADLHIDITRTSSTKEVLEFCLLSGFEMESATTLDTDSRSWNEAKCAHLLKFLLCHKDNVLSRTRGG